MYGSRAYAETNQEQEQSNCNSKPSRWSPLHRQSDTLRCNGRGAKLGEHHPRDPNANQPKAEKRIGWQAKKMIKFW